MKVVHGLLLSLCALATITRAGKVIRQQPSTRTAARSIKIEDETVLSEPFKGHADEILRHPRSDFHPLCHDDGTNPCKTPQPANFPNKKDKVAGKTRKRRSGEFDCPSFPSQEEIDAKISEHETVFSQSRTLYVRWLVEPFEKVVITLAASKPDTGNNLYISTDGGVNFELAIGINEEVFRFDVSDHLNKYGAYTIYALASDPKKEYLFVSFDSGASFKLVDTEGVVFDTILNNPHSADTALALKFDEDSELDLMSVYSFYPDKEKAEWKFTFLASNVQDIDFLNNPNSPHEVIYTKFEKSNPTSPYDGINIFTQLLGSQATLIKEDCYMFELVAAEDGADDDYFLFVTQVPADDHFDEKSLFISTDFGKTFKEADFHIEGVENHYNVVDATEDMVLVVVAHTKLKTEGQTTITYLSEGKEVIVPVVKDLWSPVLNDLPAEIVYNPIHNLGCIDTGGIVDNVVGKIVVIDRGSCPFLQKIQVAEDAGAVAVIIVNNQPDENGYVRMIPPVGVETSFPEIPAFFVLQSFGQGIKDALAILGEQQPLIGTIEEKNVNEIAWGIGNNLYTAARDETSFTKSLENIRYNPEFTSEDNPELTIPELVDIHKVESESGVYIANVALDSTKLASRITYNFGGGWEPISLDDPPANCDGCTLHLSLETGGLIFGYPLPKSVDEAQGIIMANGYYDSKMDFTGREEPNVYISLDGGYSWDIPAVFKDQGPHKFDILDHGTVLAAAKYRAATDSVWYSLNMGRTPWMTREFTVTPGTKALQGFVSEPNGAGLTFFGFYYDRQRDGFVGVTWDFSPVFENECTDDSYEDYYLGDPDEEPVCLLGSQIYVQRRKACDVCRNGHDYEVEQPVIQSSCDCTFEDFRCAAGFARNFEKPESPCVADQRDLLHCDVAGQTTLTKVPYEQLFGDKCIKPDDFQTPVTIPCVKKPPPPGPTTISPVSDTTTASTTTTSTTTTSTTTASTTTTSAPPSTAITAVTATTTTTVPATVTTTATVITTPAKTATATQPTATPAVATSTNNPTTDGHITNSAPGTSPAVVPKTIPTASTTGSATVDAQRKKKKSHNTNGYIIAGVILSVALILSIIVAVVYRHRAKIAASVKSFVGSNPYVYSELAELNAELAGDSDEDMLDFDEDDTPTLVGGQSQAAANNNSNNNNAANQIFTGRLEPGEGFLQGDVAEEKPTNGPPNSSVYESPDELMDEGPSNTINFAAGDDDDWSTDA